MPPDVWKTRAILFVVIGVLAWGIFHAVGAYLFNHDVRRALVVLACVLGFLAFWGLMLRSRSRQVRGQKSEVRSRKSEVGGQRSE